MKKILTAIFVIMLSTVSVSSNEIEYQKVIRSQIEAFSNDDMEAAFEFASPSIKSIFGNYIRFGSMVRQGYPMVFRQKNLTFKETKSKNSVAFQNVLIEDLSGDLHLLRYRLILLKGSWKIAGVEFLRTEIMAI
ncbi:DUF4864 domain-containing protein [Amylibacter sp.]|nr:DUF4864 domain-containing protein [Amylibacter sp.]MDC1293282.1 DUF4864 domain-containing protein [Amylibacter sp.]MDC1532530.1 DUF4864 domain-containing protein [Amylibacter sp.]